MRVYSGACRGVATEYGVGLAGSGGFVPHLSAQGCPGITGTFGVTLDQTLGGAAGQLLIGASQASVPLAGGTLLVALPWVMVPLVTPGIGAGAGALEIPVFIQDDPSLQGVQLYAQAVLADAGGPQGYSWSNGLSVSFQ